MRTSTTYVIGGPKTLRLGSRKILGKYGGNLQNWEKSMRELVESDGYNEDLFNKCNYYLQSQDHSIFTEEELMKLRIFVQSDQSGAEALIVAYCCEAKQYRELFKNNIKPHSFLGMHLFDKIWPNKMREHNVISADSDFNIRELCSLPISGLKSHHWWKPLDNLIKDSDNWPLTERYYYLAKQTEHSSNYNVGAAMFQMNTLEKSGGKIVINRDDAERFLLTKFALFPEIKGYHRWIEETAKRTKILYNLHGHPYQITHWEIQDTQLKELYSWIPQSTVGEITHVAFTKMYHYIVENNLKWDVLQNNHDSYLVQCPLLEWKLCVEKSKEFLAQEFKSPIDGATFNMRSDAQIGFNWGVMKKKLDGTVINPLGLR